MRISLLPVGELDPSFSHDIALCRTEPAQQDFQAGCKRASDIKLSRDETEQGQVETYVALVSKTKHYWRRFGQDTAT